MTPPRNRFAFALLIISTVNWLGIVLYTLAGWAVNSITYLAAHGRPPARHTLDGQLSDSVGLYPFPVPWWLFAFGGVVLVVVAIAALPVANRIVLPMERRAPVMQTTPGFLAYLGFFAAVAMLWAIQSYDGLTSVFDAYYVGPVLGIVAGTISLLRWQRDAPPITSKKPYEPSRLAEALGVLLAADFLATLVFGFGGIVVNQTIYISVHAGALPPGSSHRYLAGFDIWPGRMPIDLPWWLFATLSGVLVLVTLVSWPAANQYGPLLDRRVFFRRASPGGLFGIAVLVLFIELWTDIYYGHGFGFGRASGLWSIGPLLAVLVLVLVLLRVAVRLLRRPSGRYFGKKRRARSRRRTKTAGKKTNG